MALRTGTEQSTGRWQTKLPQSAARHIRGHTINSPTPSPRNFQPNAMNLSMPPNDAERKKFRDQFLNAEQELAAAKGREEALQDQLMREVKFQHEMNLRKKAETSAAAAEEKVCLLERKLSSVSENIEREKSRLGNELEQLKNESMFSVTKISKNLDRMKFRATNAEKESVLLKEQLEELRKRLDKCMQQKIEAEKKLSNFTFQEGCSSDNNILVKHLQEELRSYEAEVHEARKLKSSHENIELLKENNT